MEDQRVGRIVRALRRRLNWRQMDLAMKADCSQRTVSRAELGHLPSVPTLRRMLGALNASLVLDVRWRAGALERLLDERHATLIGKVSDFLARLGWEVQVEVTYSEYGERGSIDVLALWRPLGILLVIEVKTDLPSVEGVLRKLDEKVRLAPKVARTRFGWQVRHVARRLILPESSTLRRRVARQNAVLVRTLPARGLEVRDWLRQPHGAIGGLWFPSFSQEVAGIRGQGGPERVRAPKRAPDTEKPAS